MKKISIMGILNITPDSFSDGGLYYDNIQSAVHRAQKMVAQGADIIDVGGESTRPGSATVPQEVELDRVIPVITALRKEFAKTITISIDTNKAIVAEEALKNGANWINSLGGFSFDKNLATVVAKYNCPCVLYHIKGEPSTMQQGTILYDDVVADIAQFFTQQIEFGTQQGINRENFIIDPGIGFGKTIEQNLEIIKRIAEFTSFNLPILLGVSRKGHLAKILQKKLALPVEPTVTQRVEAGLAEAAIGIVNGATIIRTHDVLETKKFTAILEELL